MRLRWTPAAAEDPENIKDHLTEHHPQFAQSAIIHLYEAELVLTRLPCIVAYRIREQAVEVLHIFHGAQNRP